MLTLRSGIDLLDIERLSTISPTIRERFIRRVYTVQEIADAADSNASLAGKFAAKEAVAKALGTGIGVVKWQEIEICSDPDRKPWLTLHGKARQIAEDLHLETWSISISHTDNQAVAVAVAVGEMKE